ncbi:MAG: translational GTPase TypA [bacterium]|nr:translational GTPase TypA [Planctomycetota bacterium]HIL52987.1 translational GTPase TypA [Planctomycetota bacterium]
MTAPNNAIRNLAIVAHVDHGKTTLVDQMFRYAGTFRENQKVAERALDSEDQERERGITILAKNTAIQYEGTRINIVDTPGHADFGGQVERTLSMADAVLLLVDAFEGPMPQTRFVLRKAFEHGLKALVMINKIDRPDSRPHEVLDEVFDLFVELGAHDEQLEFPVVYGSGRDGYAMREPEDDSDDLGPLFAMILEQVPTPKIDLEGHMQFQAITLEHDDFVGRIAVGRVSRGVLKAGQRVAVCHPYRARPLPATVKKLYSYQGLERVAVDSVPCGDIGVIAGIAEIEIGDTLCPLEHPDPLPKIEIDEPTISMEFVVNDSPFAGTEGAYVTSRHLQTRLDKAAVRDMALSITRTDRTDSFQVNGRGVMHLGVLIERMRREGYEFAVGKPRVILKDVDGTICEPYERATVEVPNENSGRIIEYLGRRRGEMLHMEALGTLTKVEFSIPARGLIGARTSLLTLSQGEAILSHVFEEWKPDGGLIPRRTSGVLVSDRGGPVLTYALDGLSDRGSFFVKPGDVVYEGMVVGEQNKAGDLPVNVCRAKKMTNIRASSKDDSASIAPPRIMSLEEALEYIEDDELLEVTPTSLRLRKRLLNADARKRHARSAAAASK